MTKRLVSAPGGGNTEENTVVENSTNSTASLVTVRKAEIRDCQPENTPENTRNLHPTNAENRMGNIELLTA